MKALVYRGPGDIRVETVPDPQLSTPTSAIVRIHACSICGSDLHPYHVHPGVDGYCIGHEAIGEVVEVGASLTKFRVGDRVLLPGTVSCGSCAPCRKGMVALCEASSRPLTYGTGAPTLGGCQAEGIEVPLADQNLYPIPQGVGDEAALALTDTLATAWASVEAGGVRPGTHVAVIGLGAVGLQTVLAAYAHGAERVFAIDMIESRLAVARSLGAETPERDRQVERIVEATEGRGVDVVIDANGSESTLGLALQLARKGGRIAVSGVPEAMTIALPAGLAISKSIHIAYVVVSVQATLRHLIPALLDGRISEARIKSLFTHRMGLGDGPAAYRLFDARRDGVVKIMLSC